MPGSRQHKPNMCSSKRQCQRACNVPMHMLQGLVRRAATAWHGFPSQCGENFKYSRIQRACAPEDPKTRLQNATGSVKANHDTLLWNDIVAAPFSLSRCSRRQELIHVDLAPESTRCTRARRSQQRCGLQRSVSHNARVEVSKSSAATQSHAMRVSRW